jgi:hypothetical protein
MNWSQTVKESFTSFLKQPELAWWVEIVTDEPQCTYYFGPFASAKEAELAQHGYIEDLKQEEAQGITVVSKWCQPKELTIFED